jgi:anti-anti-sigma factor
VDIGPFAVAKESRNGVVFLRPQGELDIATVPTLSHALAEAEREAELQIVVDLSDLSFIDVTGVRGLAEAYQRVNGNGITLAVVRPQPWIRKVLHLTRSDFLLGSPRAGEDARSNGR